MKLAPILISFGLPGISEPNLGLSLKNLRRSLGLLCKEGDFLPDADC